MAEAFEHRHEGEGTRTVARVDSVGTGRTLFETWRANKLQVLAAGKVALEAARAAGGPIHYMDRAYQRGIVKEMPDGRRYLIETIDGRPVVLRQIARRLKPIVRRRPRSLAP